MAARVTTDQVAVLMIAPSHVRVTAENSAAIIENKSNARVTNITMVAFVKILPPPVKPMLNVWW